MIILFNELFFLFFKNKFKNFFNFNIRYIHNLIFSQFGFITGKFPLISKNK